MAAMLICWNLQDHSSKRTQLSALTSALKLLTQDVFQSGADPGTKAETLLHRRLGKLGVERGQVGLSQVLVGLGHVRDARQRQLLRQAPLMGSKGAL